MIIPPVMRSLSLCLQRKFGLLDKIQTTILLSRKREGALFFQGRFRDRSYQTLSVDQLKSWQ